MESLCLRVPICPCKSTLIPLVLNQFLLRTRLVVSFSHLYDLIRHIFNETKGKKVKKNDHIFFPIALVFLLPPPPPPPVPPFSFLFYVLLAIAKCTTIFSYPVTYIFSVATSFCFCSS